MKRALTLLTGIVCALGLVFAAEARGSAKKAPKKAPGSHGSGSSAKKGATNNFGPDHNFGCDLSHETLRPFTAAGYRVSPAVKANLKLWKSVTAAGLPAASRAKCRSMSPATVFIKTPGNGGLTRADIAVVTHDMPIYRGWSSGPFPCSLATPAGEYGGWWAFKAFPAQKAQYRRETAVCPSWNNFDHKIQCTIKKGTVVVIGPGQSANCSAGPHGCTPAAKKAFSKKPTHFGSSPEHQVFLNTYNRTPADLHAFLTGCHSVAWTQAEHP